MQKTIISDTSCLILLEKIGELNLLQKLFGEVIITSIIAAEFGNALPEWIKIVDAADKKYQNSLHEIVDKGEASAIALAMESPNCLLILDDQKARKLAAGLGLKYTGTIGILVDAKESGYIPLLKPVLEKIQQTNFRLTPQLEKKILELVGE